MKTPRGPQRGDPPGQDKVKKETNPQKKKRDPTRQFMCDNFRCRTFGAVMSTASIVCAASAAPFARLLTGYPLEISITWMAATTLDKNQARAGQTENAVSTPGGANI
jgi:hypothetical protein